MTARSAPITRHINRIVAALRRISSEGDVNHLRFSDLISAIGPQAHRLLILMLTLLNMIPGPPGYGGTVAWTGFAVALAMVLNRPIRLPGLIGRRRLPLRPLLTASEQIAKIAAIIARFSRPRLRFLTGAKANVPYGLFAMLISVAMTIPVPFVNAVPNVGLCILAFSMLNRDGFGAVLGVLVCLLGLGVEAALILGAINLGMGAIEAMR